jgi:hypothetical protein
MVSGVTSYAVVRSCSQILSRRLFLIAVGSMIILGVKNYLFSSAANDLTGRLRSLAFKAMLRQDSE